MRTSYRLQIHVMLILMGLLPGFSSSLALAYSVGSGTQSNPYQIAGKADLLELAADTANYDKAFALVTDVNLAGEIFSSAVIADSNIPFSGTFDGRQHVISHLTIEADEIDNVGLFGWTSGAHIHHVGLEAVSIEAIGDCNNYIGGLVGYCENSTVSYCTVTGSVDGDENDDVGILIGQTAESSTVSYCSSSGEVWGWEDIGGLVGDSDDGSLSHCSSTASASGHEDVGGLLGDSDDSTISNCYATGTVEGEEDLGGLVGDSENSTITQCYTTGMVEGEEDLGGLVGDSYQCTISHCYATGGINGEETTGGLVGESTYDQISDCHATGQVESEVEIVGGLVGDAYESTLFKCYATGDVNAIRGVGGLVGICYDPTITNSYATGNVYVGSGSPFIEDYYDYGGLIGYNEHGTITGCNASGDVNGVESVGGLIGYSEESTISQCSATGQVGGEFDVGGLVGWSEEVSISDCDASGNVNGEYSVGGLVGYRFAGSITDCSATGHVEGFVYAGGLVGVSEEGSINRCSATGDINGFADIGGLAGVGDNCEINQCYATGDAEGEDEAVGGLIGYGYECLISDCYAWGSATGEFGVGGLVGITDGQTITHCYAIGLVDGDESAGGFTGTYEEVDDTTYIDCFWDIETSGTTVAVGDGDDTGITGHDTDTMQTLRTFLDANWDFETIWGMVDYPQFQWGIYNLVLSSSAGGGIVDPGEGVFYFDPGTKVWLESEVTDPLFVFSHFEGNLWASTTPYILTVNHDYHIRAVFESLLDVLYVDANAPEGAYENGTTEFPFDSIQEAVEVAADSSTVVVRPGTYHENIELSNKAITLTGVDVNDANDWSWPVILGTGDGPAVTLRNCDPNTLLQGLVINGGKGREAGGIDCIKSSVTLANCLITGNRSQVGGAGLCAHESDVTLINCTLSDNFGGAEGAGLNANSNSILTISDSILWNNEPNEFLCDETSICLIQYSTIQDGAGGMGNLALDPLFVAPGWWEHVLNPGLHVSPSDSHAIWMAGDYHLGEGSPCIDAGDPNAPYELEPLPNGDRLNMGAYGNTPQASVSPEE